MPKINYLKFSQNIKSQYPEYKDWNDLELAEYFVAQEPRYSQSVDFGDLKKKDQAAPSLGAQGGLPSQQPSAQPRKAREERFFGGTFGDLLDALDMPTPGVPGSGLGIGDFIDDMGRAFSSGKKAGVNISTSRPLFFSGPGSSDEEVQNFVKAGTEYTGPSDEATQFYKDYEDNGKTTFGFVKALAKNPGVAPELVVQSASQFLFNPEARAAFGASIAAGAGIGALASAPLGGIGAAPGAIAAILPGVAAANTAVSTLSSFSELMKQELDQRGLEFNEDNVRTILEDEKALRKIRAKSAGYGITIGAFDLATAKVGGAIAAKIPMTTRAGKIKSTLATTGVEAVGGSAGEAAARGVTGQELDPAEIGLEGIAEIPGAAPTLLSQVLKRPTYKINGEFVGQADVDDILQNSSRQELENTKFEVFNDVNTYGEKFRNRLEELGLLEEITEANPNASEADINRLFELNSKLKKVENLNSESAKASADWLRSQIREVQDGLLTQEFTPQEVQQVEEAAPEAPQMAPAEVSPEVGMEVPQAEQAPQMAPLEDLEFDNIEFVEPVITPVETQLVGEKKSPLIKETFPAQEGVKRPRRKPGEVRTPLMEQVTEGGVFKAKVRDSRTGTEFIIEDPELSLDLAIAAQVKESGRTAFPQPAFLEAFNEVIDADPELQTLFPNISETGQPLALEQKVVSLDGKKVTRNVAQRMQPIYGALEQRMENAEEIPMSEIESVVDQIIQAQQEIQGQEKTKTIRAANGVRQEFTPLNEEQKRIFNDFTESLVNKLLSYEFATTTTTGPATQKTTAAGLIATPREGRPLQESRVQREKLDGAEVTVEGRGRGRISIKPLPGLGERSVYGITFEEVGAQAPETISPTTRETGTTPAAVGVEPQTEQDVRQETNAPQEGRAQGENAAPVPQEEGRQEGQVTPPAVAQEGETPPAAKRTRKTEQQKADEGKAILDKLKETLRALKAKPGGGANIDLTFGVVPISKAVWNTAIDTAILAIDAGQSIAQAVKAASDYISSKVDGDWGKAKFEQYLGAKFADSGLTKEGAPIPQEGDISVKDVKVVKGEDFKFDAEWEVRLGDRVIGRLWYDRSIQFWMNTDTMFGPGTATNPFKGILGSTKEEAIEKLVDDYNKSEKAKETKKEVQGVEERNFSNDKVLNRFLNRLSSLGSLEIPFFGEGFVYNGKALVEFDRFDKGGRNEVALRSIMTIDDTGKGVGSEVMSDITSAADELGTKLTLYASPFGTKAMSPSKLVSFYKKFGFTIDLNEAFGGDFSSEKSLLEYLDENPGEGVDMVRDPQVNPRASERGVALNKLEETLRSLKVKVDGNVAREATFMIPALIYNSAIDVAILAVKAGKTVANAVIVAVKYINKNFDGEWDKGGFTDKMIVDLTKPKTELTISGLKNEVSSLIDRYNDEEKNGGKPILSLHESIYDKFRKEVTQELNNINALSESIGQGDAELLKALAMDMEQVVSGMEPKVSPAIMKQDRPLNIGDVWFDLKRISKRDSESINLDTLKEEAENITIDDLTIDELKKAIPFLEIKSYVVTNRRDRVFDLVRTDTYDLAKKLFRLDLDDLSVLSGILPQDAGKALNEYIGNIKKSIDAIRTDSSPSEIYTYPTEPQQQAQPEAQVEATAKALEGLASDKFRLGSSEETPTAINVDYGDISWPQSGLSSFNEGSDGKTYATDKNGDIYQVSKTKLSANKTFLVTIKNTNGEDVGSFEFKRNSDGSFSAEEAYASKKGVGIATIAYDLASKDGEIIRPSKKLKKDGVQFWAKSISNAYHKAKTDGSNPKLVQAVEELLGQTAPEAKPAKTIADQRKEFRETAKKYFDGLKKMGIAFDPEGNSKEDIAFLKALAKYIKLELDAGMVTFKGFLEKTANLIEGFNEKSVVAAAKEAWAKEVVKAYPKLYAKYNAAKRKELEREIKDIRKTMIRRIMDMTDPKIVNFKSQLKTEKRRLSKEAAAQLAAIRNAYDAKTMMAMEPQDLMELLNLTEGIYKEGRSEIKALNESLDEAAQIQGEQMLEAISSKNKRLDKLESKEVARRKLANKAGIVVAIKGDDRIIMKEEKDLEALDGEGYTFLFLNTISDKAIEGNLFQNIARFFSENVRSLRENARDLRTGLELIKSGNKQSQDFINGLVEKMNKASVEKARKEQSWSKLLKEQRKAFFGSDLNFRYTNWMQGVPKMNGKPMVLRNGGNEKIGGINNAKIVTLFRQMMDPTNLVKTKGVRKIDLSDESIRQIIDYMNLPENKAGKGFALSLNGFFEKVAMDTAATLEENGYNAKKLEPKRYNKEDFADDTFIGDIMNQLSETRTEGFIPYTPIQATESPDTVQGAQINEDDLLNPGDVQKNFSVISNNMITRKPGGVIVPTDIRQALNSYTAGMANMNAKLPILRDTQVIFSKKNLTAMSNAFAPQFAENLKSNYISFMTDRVTPVSSSKSSAAFKTWLMTSTAIPMFFNPKSALLQFLAVPNFMVSYDITRYFSASKKLISDPVLFKDLAVQIINLPTMRQRFGGRFSPDSRVVNEEMKRYGNLAITLPLTNLKISAKELLAKGYLPSSLGDIGTIAIGGAPVYYDILQRNKAKYLAQGMSEDQASARAKSDAEEKLFEIIQETQQSSEAMYLSEFQKQSFTRLFTSFATATQQYYRKARRAAARMKNKEGNQLQNAYEILHYTAINAAVFQFFSSMLMDAISGPGEDELEEMSRQERMDLVRYMESIMETVAQGTGGIGVALQAIILASKEMAKSGKPEKVLESVLRTMPAARIKYDAGLNALREWKRGDYVRAFTKGGEVANIPTDRIRALVVQVSEALTENLEAQERIARITSFRTESWMREKREREIWNGVQSAVDKSTPAERQRAISNTKSAYRDLFQLYGKRYAEATTEAEKARVDSIASKELLNVYNHRQGGPEFTEELQKLFNQSAEFNSLPKDMQKLKNMETNRKIGDVVEEVLSLEKKSEQKAMEYWSSLVNNGILSKNEIERVREEYNTRKGLQ